VTIQQALRGHAERINYNTIEGTLLAAAERIDELERPPPSTSPDNGTEVGHILEQAYREIGECDEFVMAMDKLGIPAAADMHTRLRNAQGFITKAIHRQRVMERRNLVALSEKLAP
jgi:hypothetical protein